MQKSEPEPFKCPTCKNHPLVKFWKSKREEFIAEPLVDIPKFLSQLKERFLRDRDRLQEQVDFLFKYLLPQCDKCSNQDEDVKPNVKMGKKRRNSPKDAASPSLNPEVYIVDVDSVPTEEREGQNPDELGELSLDNQEATPLPPSPLAISFINPQDNNLKADVPQGSRPNYIIDDSPDNTRLPNEPMRKKRRNESEEASTPLSIPEVHSVKLESVTAKDRKIKRSTQIDKVLADDRDVKPALDPIGSISPKDTNLISDKSHSSRSTNHIKDLHTGCYFQAIKDDIVMDAKEYSKFKKDAVKLMKRKSSYYTCICKVCKSRNAVNSDDENGIVMHLLETDGFLFRCVECKKDHKSIGRFRFDHCVRRRLSSRNHY